MCDNPYLAIKRGDIIHKKLPDGSTYRKVYTEDVETRCGKCPVCRKRYVSDYTIRLQEEDKVSSSSFFITLTYAPEHVPLTETNQMTLVKQHHKNFIKALRKRNKATIRYFGVGEYGDLGSRPHYHIILFNLEDAKLIGKSKEGYPEYYSKAVDKSWNKGNIQIRAVGFESIAYTLSYMNKGRKIGHHPNDPREPEFNLKSKGLGKAWLTEENIKQAILQGRNYMTVNGYKKPMPRYYKDKIFDEEQKQFFRMKAEKEKQNRIEKRQREYDKKYKTKKINILDIEDQERYARGLKFNNQN